MKFHPLHDRVLVERIEEEVTKGGIVIPDQAKEKPCRGKVIAIGTGRLAEDGSVTPMTVKTDDIILFGKYAGTDVKIDDKELVVMREDDIMGVFKA